ncbi:MAG: hypothetical protein KDK36_14605, partial [Leptospiraceae bacterium]|nr:hypothetical protein [Leptospiraceae bacterium]
MKFIFLFLIIILNFSNCWNQDSKNPPEAVKGVIDLRNWDFNSKNNSRDNIIHLKGEWEFYWKKLCNPISIDKNNNSLKTNCFPTENDYLKVPGNWDRYISEGKEIGGKGFASYRLKVLLPPNFLEPLEIKIPNIGTAYNFWVNGELLGNAGIVSEIEDQGKMGHFPKVYLIQSKNFLKSENDQNYFNLQVDISNYHYYSGGFWYNVQLGNYNSVTTQMFYSELIDFLLMGSILLMGFYHIILFVLRKQDPSTFWLGLYCLPISIRMLLTGEKFLERHFPEYSQFFLFIEYLSLIFLVPIFLNFLYWLFPKLISNSLSKIITIGAYFLSLPIIILPSYYYTRILTIIQIYVIIAAILATNILFKALITKKQGAKIFFFGWIIFFIAIINDILYFQGFIQTGEFTPVGLLLIIFSQTIVLSLRFTGAFSEVENLSKELETINKSLEKKISERTKDLQEASSEIEELNKFTYIVNSLSDLDEIFTEISKHVYYKYGISA